MDPKVIGEMVVPLRWYPNCPSCFTPPRNPLKGDILNRNTHVILRCIHGIDLLRGPYHPKLYHHVPYDILGGSFKYFEEASHVDQIFSNGFKKHQLVPS